MSFFRRGTQEKVRVDRLWNRTQPRTSGGGSSGTVVGSVTYSPSNVADWSTGLPTTVQQALDILAARLASSEVSTAYTPTMMFNGMES